MGLKIHIDGKLVDEKDAKVSVFDHGFLYGDGIFEGIRAYGGKVFRLEEHLARLYASARAIALEVPMEPGDLGKAIEDTMRANGLTDAYIRVVITRGRGDLGLDPRKCGSPTVVIITASIELYSEELYEKGLEIVTAATARIPPGSLDPRIKSCNYLNNILAKIEGINAGCVEAIMLNHLGHVAECTGDNIFSVRGGRILTPPEEAGILKGITRDVVMGLAREQGYEVAEQNITRYDLYSADEVFLTGTAAEIIAVVKIDGRTIGSGREGEVTRKLRNRFKGLIAGAS